MEIRRLKTVKNRTDDYGETCSAWLTAKLNSGSGWATIEGGESVPVSDGSRVEGEFIIIR